jgi:hypothetical protein
MALMAQAVMREHQAACVSASGSGMLRRSLMAASSASWQQQRRLLLKPCMRTELQQLQWQMCHVLRAKM